MQAAKTLRKLRIVSSVPKSRLELTIARTKLEAWVRRYGTNSSSYVLLEGSKSYFTSPAVDGFIAYKIKAGVAVVGGDPVCPPGQARKLISDFIGSLRGRP